MDLGRVVLERVRGSRVKSGEGGRWADDGSKGLSQIHEFLALRRGRHLEVILEAAELCYPEGSTSFCPLPHG